MSSAAPRRRAAALGAVALCTAIVVVLWSATLGWACVPQPLVWVEPASSGPAGSEVEVHALSLSGGQAEVRWNGIDGEVLATGGGSELSETMTIPDAPPGLYSIILIERDANGAVGASGRAAFLVTDPSGPSEPDSGETGTAVGDDAPAPQSSSSSLSAPVAWLGGAGLLVLGVLGGIVLSRNRGRTGGSVQG